jgi:hypothetical protein
MHTPGCSWCLFMVRLFIVRRAGRLVHSTSATDLADASVDVRAGPGQ